jgi:predicted acyltransferase
MAVTPQDRLISLDVFRGLTIGAMVLVNNPGSWGSVYPPLLHAEWHGWTFTDTIFPFFLFIVGIAIPMALGKRLEQGPADGALYMKIVRRTVLMFALGLWLALFPFYNWVKGEWVNLPELRIMGVLQRIAICYLVCSLLFIWLKPRALIAVTIGLLLAYWGLMSLGGDLSKEGNLAAIIDRAVLGPHIWKGGGGAYDPEGLLSTVPAIATTMIGVLTGLWLNRKAEAHETVSTMFYWGFILLLAGWMWSAFFPINKPIWSSSYAVFMAGAGLLVLAACIWLIDIKKVTWWTGPFVVFGVNALALFVGSGMLARLLNYIPAGLKPDGSPLPLKDAIYQNAFLPLAEPINASLLFAIATILVWLFLMWLLYRKKIYIKI